MSAVRPAKPASHPGTTFPDLVAARRYRTLLDSLDAGFCVVEVLFDANGETADYRYLEVNESFRRLTGLADPVGRTVRELEPRHEAHWFETYGRVARTGCPERFVHHARHLGDRWYEEYAFPIDGHVGVLFTDVTERQRVDEAVRASEARFRDFADAAPATLWVTDPDGVCTFLSRGWYEFTGQTEATGLGFGWLDAVHPDDRPGARDAFLAANARRGPFALEHRLRGADGEYRWVIDAGRPRVARDGEFLGYIGSVIDIDDRRRVEETLRQSQKMEAFGQLAGGVAHDFNNMLQVINGYANLALGQVAPGDPIAGLLVEIQKAGERSAALTRQLLAFSRQQVAAPRIVDIGIVAAGTAGMLRRVIGEDVRLATDLPAGVWPTFADPGQVEQVLLNLAVNARDAMPGGGTLSVSLRNEWVAEEDALEQVGAKAGPHAVLSVSDSGTGMPPDVLARVFEPFFTTKEVGKGTGLGLATVYGIVQQAGGHLRVRSQPGMGSTFEVFLPRAGEGGHAEESAIHPARATVSRGSETILVVEDEPVVGAFVRTVLADRGYVVLEAADGESAERVAAGHPGPIHLVLSDVVMPGAGGRSAAERVLATHPEARVAFMSGYAGDPLTRQGLSAEDVPFLPKPFSPSALTTLVRQVLDGTR